jgi:Hg(II)-responsive transcriptional regulator
MMCLTIGKLAKEAGVSIDTVRFYERRGLIAEPERTESNYRIYPETEVARLKFIRKAKILGFSLNEIKELLVLRHTPGGTKDEVKAKVEEKITSIKQKIADLGRILNALEHLNNFCDGHGPAEECPILEALENHDETL